MFFLIYKEGADEAILEYFRGQLMGLSISHHQTEVARLDLDDESITRHAQKLSQNNDYMGALLISRTDMVLMGPSFEARRVSPVTATVARKLGGSLALFTPQKALT